MSVDREAALKRLRSFRIRLPEGYKFDREEANSRGRESLSEAVAALRAMPKPDDVDERDASELPERE